MPGGAWVGPWRSFAPTFVELARVAAYAWRIGIATAKPMRRMENGRDVGWPTTRALCMRGLTGAAMRRRRKIDFELAQLSWE